MNSKNSMLKNLHGSLKAVKMCTQNIKRNIRSSQNTIIPSEKKDEISELKKEYTEMVVKEKEKYLISLGNKLSDPQIGQKKYWSILKKLLKKNVCSLIPPLNYFDQFVVDADQKCKIFGEFFKKNCLPILTSSTLPPLIKTTSLSIKNVNFSEEDIIRHIRKLNPNKAHGHDEIPIRILKMFDKSISKPIFHIYKNCIKHK